MAIENGNAAEDVDTPPAQLVCTFASGTSVSYDKGEFTSKAASPLSFSITKIDLEGQSAALTAGGVAISRSVFASCAP